jgi:tetratricopeptide (TPR) repeat protein
VPIRILVHKSTAAYLEAHHGKPARIAQHWLDASDFDRAVPAMINAAEAAQHMARDDEALDLLERAIALPVVSDQRHIAQAMLGGIYVLKNRFEDAEHSLNSLLEVVSDPEAHWLALDHLCYLHIRKGSLETAQRYGELALELATLHGVASRLQETCYKLGVIAHYTGENQRAVELILPTVEFLREQPANVNFLNALGALGQSLRELGRTNEALFYEDEMVRHAKTMDADHVIANHLGNTLYRDFLRGDASEAISNAENYLSDLERRGSDVDVCSLRSNMAAIYARLERPDDAIGHYTTLTLHANLEYHMSAWANLAVLHTKKLQPEAARLALARALELAPDNDYPTPRFALIRAVYTLGTPEQRAQAQPYLDALNFDALPAIYRTELEELLSAKL